MVEHELNFAKQDFLTSNLNYVFSLNELQSVKKLEVFERICSSIYSQNAYFHQGYESFRELEPQLNAVSSHIQKVHIYH